MTSSTHSETFPWQTCVACDLENQKERSPDVSGTSPDSIRPESKPCSFNTWTWMRVATGGNYTNRAQQQSNLMLLRLSSFTSQQVMAGPCDGTCADVHAIMHSESARHLMPLITSGCKRSVRLCNPANAE